MAISMARTMSVTVLETMEDWSDDGDCRTPTAAESRIPEVATCPPAPMKQRPVGLPSSAPESYTAHLPGRVLLLNYTRGATNTEKYVKGPNLANQTWALMSIVHFGEGYNI